MARRPKQVVKRARAALATFLGTETAGGSILLAAAVVALVWANLSPTYEALWHRSAAFGPFDLDLRHWVNEGLMTIFFFVVGLEIKRELVVGELRERRVAVLPIAAAAGGMLAPALVYLAINAGSPTVSGWAIPMATDIAFVVGAMALLGDRVPSGLKAFLLALAIVDDIGAILVIALAFSSDVDVRWIGLTGVCVGAVGVFRALRVDRPYLYLLPGLGMWFGALNAGIHPTLAGVVLGLLIPAQPIGDRYVLDELEVRLHPVSSLVIVPLFALANAGVELGGGALSDAIGSRVALGIGAGLLVGKTAGIFGASMLVERLPFARRPRSVTRTHLAGGAALAGIGFTVSLFLSALAFDSDALVAEAKIGVLGGSAASAAVGAVVLLRTRRPGRS